MKCTLGLIEFAHLTATKKNSTECERSDTDKQANFNQFFLFKPSISKISNERKVFDGFAVG